MIQFYKCTNEICWKPYFFKTDDYIEIGWLKWLLSWTKENIKE